MEISFTTAAEQMADLKNDVKDITGYSHASYQIVQSMANFGIDVKIASRVAPVCVSMGFPIDYKFYPNQYRIGYTAWESTHLKDGWRESMLNCDEVWATSSWTADVFKEELGKEDIHVYPHGIDMDWRPVKRKRKEKFRFLHIGEPQVRKNGQLVVEAFAELFGNDPDYQLVLKCSNINTTRVFHDDGSIAGGPDNKYSNIVITTAPLTHVQMIELYSKTNAMIYPTMGEGFGFIPLQALATGMPTISTYQWAEYKKFITIPLEAQLGPSEYPALHPGDVYHVTKEELKKSMIDMVNNYDSYAQQSFKNSFKVHMEYDWDAVTKPTAEKIKNIFKSRGF
jgi:glycosyltransferase involved in cell wall biosynthesis